MMIEINLLPKDFQKKSFDFTLGKTGAYIVGGAVGVVLMLFVITFYQKQQMNDLDTNIVKAKQRAAMLQKDIQVVDALMDVKVKISDRMTAVEKLDRHRSAWVRVLEDVSNNIPEFIWLGRLSEESASAPKKDTQDKAKGDKAVATVDLFETRKVTIEGYAFTLNSLAKLMINMMRSDYFDQVELVSTQEKKLEEQKAYNFVLTSRLHFLTDEELRGLIANNGKEEKSGSHKTLN